MKILTLYLAKDHIDPELFSLAANQMSIEQCLIVVSTVPIKERVTNNLVVIPPPHYKTVPYRVAYSINKALDRYWDPSIYSHLFKLDSDVKLPPTYLKDQIALNKVIVGSGGCLLIQTSYFEKYQKRWIPCFLDDYAVVAKAFGLGYNSEVWESDYVITPNNFTNKGKWLEIGCSFYEVGHPLISVFVELFSELKNYGIMEALNKKHNIKSLSYVTIGYLMSIGNPKFLWSKKFNRRFKLLLFHRLTSFFLKRGSLQ